jgi:hypothetical protein
MGPLTGPSSNELEKYNFLPLIQYTTISCGRYKVDTPSGVGINLVKVVFPAAEVGKYDDDSKAA